MKKLQILDRKIHRIMSSINLEIINPNNIENEKYKFYSNAHYNPQFSYNNNKINFQKKINQLKKLKFPKNTLGNLLRLKVVESIRTIEMYKNRGNPVKFTRMSKLIYGYPSKKLVVIAKKYCREDPNKVSSDKSSIMSINSENAVKVFKKTLNNLGIKWKVEQKNIVAIAMVIPRQRKLIIKKNHKYSRIQLKRLIAHEIYGHILRAEIGFHQPYSIFSTGMPYYEATEEGLALFKEQKLGVLNKRALKGYAGRILAVKFGIENSFNTTYKFLRKYYSKYQAWNLTVRVKRGLTDTSKQGGFTKDIVYLKGYLDIKKFVKNDSCLHLLHYGKIGIKEAMLIPSIEGLKDPNHIIKNKRIMKGDIYSHLFW